MTSASSTRAMSICSGQVKTNNMNTHIPSHLAPYLEEYEKQEAIGIDRLEELRYLYLSKRDGMSRTERRAWQRMLKKNKANIYKKGGKK